MARPPRRKAGQKNRKAAAGSAQAPVTSSASAAAATRLQHPFGELELHCYPRRKQELLQAWDGADKLLLAYIAEHYPAPQKILIVNERFGGTCLALQQAGHHISLWGDSALSAWGIRENAATNTLSAPDYIACTEAPPQADIVLMRLPKSLSLLRYQLQTLRFHSQPQAIIGAGMVKHLGKSLFAEFEQQCGELRSSLAKYKARLLIADSEDFAKAKAQPAEDDRKQLLASDYQLQLNNRAGVFSRDKIDRGSRLLISCFEQAPPAQRIADIGCGNGLLSIMAQRNCPDAEVHGFDVSALAVDSAAENHTAANLGNQATAQWHWCHGMRAFTHTEAPAGETEKPHGFDWILCNPPFHQDQQVGDFIAQCMFADAKQALNHGGQLWVVGNRHLGYHHSLRRYFRSVDAINSDAKFVVLACRNN